MLQPLRWRCVECVIHHERDVHEEQQYIYVAQTSNNRVISAGDLYCCLLPKCEALHTCRSGFSDCNTMVLLPGCGGRAEFSLHTRNVRSVWFVVKRGDIVATSLVALRLLFDSPQTGCARRGNTIWMWRKQAIIEWSRHVNSIVACCHSVKLCAYAAQAFAIATLDMNGLCPGIVSF